MELSPQQLGYLFEDYVEEILHHRGYSAWSLETLPEMEAFNCGLINDQNEERIKRRERNGKPSYLDYGVDLIIRDQKTYYAGQCKYGYAKGITQKDLSGIFHMMASMQTRGWLFAGPTLKLSQAFLEYPVQTLTCEEMEMPEEDIQRLAQLRGYSGTIDESAEEEEKDKVMEERDYQIKILAQMKKHYGAEDKGVLAMPCRTGKTYLSFKWAQDYGDVVFVAPLRSQVRQGVKRFTNTYGGGYEGLLVDSDEGRVPTRKEIKAHIKKAHRSQKKVMLGVTYCSVEVLNKVVPLLLNPVIIVDEFHNLPGKVIGEWSEDEEGVELKESDHPMYSFLRQDHVKYLYMSATPKLFELEEEDEDDDPHEELFGKTAGQMPFSEAFGKHICDYRVYVPMIDELKETSVGTLKKQIGLESLNHVPREMLLRSYFLLKAMIDQGMRKTIVYCQNCDDLNSMFQVIGALTDYFGIKVNRYWIDARASVARRKKSFEKFQNCKRRCVFLSVRILDEGIDLPSSDSVYISHKMSAGGRVVQRMSRCLTKHGQKTIGQVLVWAEEGSDLRELFSSIREVDPEFKKKIGTTSVKMRKQAEKTDDEKKESIQMDELMRYVVGVKEWRMIGWKDKLRALDQFVGRHGRRPSTHKKEEKKLADWERTQLKNHPKKKQIMSDPSIWKLWEQHLARYSDIYKSNEDLWKEKLKELDHFLTQHQRRPLRSKKEEKNLAEWDGYQLRNHPKKKQIMSDLSIRKLWEQHLVRYEDLYRSGLEAFKHKLSRLQQFVEIHQHRPYWSASKGSEERYLAVWESHSIKHYTRYIGILKKTKARKLWEAYISKNEELHRSGLEAFKHKLAQLQRFIETHQHRPRQSASKGSEERSLAMWNVNSIRKYSNKRGILKSLEARLLMEAHLLKYEQLYTHPTIKNQITQIKEKKAPKSLQPKKKKIPKKKIYVEPEDEESDEPKPKKSKRLSSKKRPQKLKKSGSQPLSI